VDAVESEMRELSTVDALRRYLDPIATVIEAGGPDDLSAQAERIREANLGDLVAAAYIRTVGALRQRGDLPGMRIALAEALKHNPSNLEAQRLMGDVHVQLGLAGDAIADYTEALRIDESDVLTHRGLAIALHLTGRPQDAIPHYRAAYRGRPSDFEIMNGFGGALAQAGQLEEAAQMLEEALRLRPDFAQAKANLERVRQALAQRAGK
jgi:Tfp pilus assembly protein PilF